MAGKTIYTLISKFFGNDIPEGMQTAFRRWFTSEAWQREKEEAIADIWEQTPSVADERTSAELDRMHRRIRNSIPAGNKKSLRQLLIRVAAVLLLPLLGAATTYLILHEGTQQIEPEWTECFVPNGEQRQLTLSDGTEVNLNSGSLLVYSASFEGKKRSLFLNGEASFKVAKDPHKPFIVKTNHMDVEALGTTFNVEAYSDSELTIATLEEGKIKVDAGTGKGETMILNPDEQVVYNHQSGTVSMKVIDAERVMQWQHGYLIFRSVSFSYLVKTIERRFDVTINYETGRFAGRSFTLKFNPDEGLNQILDIMKEMIPGLNYKIKGKVIYIN